MTEPLLVRIARGDRAAVGECIDRHGPLVWALARRGGGDRSEVEDAVQEIFIELWRNACRFDPEVASETTFVAMIARRRLIDRRRRAARRPDTSPLPEGLEVGTGSPASLAEAKDEAARAASCLGQLREEQRRVLGLALRDGLTHEEIARATGMPLGTVKTHARRGLIRLRELLGLAPAAVAAPSGEIREVAP